MLPLLISSGAAGVGEDAVSVGGDGRRAGRGGDRGGQRGDGETWGQRPEGAGREAHARRFSSSPRARIGGPPSGPAGQEPEPGLVRFSARPTERWRAAGCPP